MVEDETEKETVLVGALLKQHREGQNVSINEVANQLHLDNRIVIAIENDDFDSQPDPIYVRGYIRSYCKLLNIDADEMLQIYQESSNCEDPEIIPEIKYPTQSSSSDKPVKAFTYLISLGLVLLVIAWWQSNFIVTGPDTSGPPVVEQVVPPEIEADTSPAESLESINLDEFLQISRPASEPLAEEVQPAPGTDILDMVTDGPDALPPESTDMMEYEIQDDDPELSTSEEIMEQDLMDIDSQDALEVGIETSNINSNNPDDFDEPSTGPDTLILTLTADSWIEIFDVNDQKVYFDLGRTGDQLTLNGTAPFDILLGFAQGVSIEYNGNPVDQAPFTRSGVARFTLGE